MIKKINAIPTAKTVFKKAHFATSLPVFEKVDAALQENDINRALTLLLNEIKINPEAKKLIKHRAHALYSSPRSEPYFLALINPETHAPYLAARKAYNERHNPSTMLH